MLKKQGERGKRENERKTEIKRETERKRYI